MKKCVKIRKILFKNWKLLFGNIYQTPTMPHMHMGASVIDKKCGQHLYDTLSESLGKVYSFICYNTLTPHVMCWDLKEGRQTFSFSV